MVNFIYKPRYDVDDLVEIMKILRSPGGCPWDREQDHHSIRKNFIEEVYEACEAIDEENADHLCEELGDVLLQVVFHARMEEEKGAFSLNDVADGICKKLILRHPHIFGDTKVKDAAEVLQNWDAIKKKEKGQKTFSDQLDGVAQSLPALMRAQKVQSRAAKAGFDWDELSGALQKVREETEEVAAAASESEARREEELGDLLFACVNAARFLHVDSEQALSRATDKFARRFKAVEALALDEGRSLKEMSLAEMDKLWDRVKEGEHAQ